MADSEAKRLRTMEEVLSKRIGLKPPGRTIAAFPFAGPIGVVKTELLKTLAEYFFGSVSKLIGSQPGYVGYSDGGQLTEAIRRVFYYFGTCVILILSCKK